MVIESKNIFIRLRAKSFLSTFSLEAKAIVEASTLAHSSGHDKVSIFSDSKSVLDAVSSSGNPRKGKYLVLLIRDLLRNAELDGKFILNLRT